MTACLASSEKKREGSEKGVMIVIYLKVFL